MPRKRVVDPRFFKDWELFEAEQQSGLPLRLAYEGLWAVADREGRFAWKPREIKLDVLPFDDVDFSLVLNGLQSAGFIQYYQLEGKDYGYIPNFTRYQPIHPREAASTIPAPPAMPTQGTPKPEQSSPKAGLGGNGDEPSPSASTSTSTSVKPIAPFIGANGTKGKPHKPPVHAHWVNEAVEIYAKHIGVIAHGKAGKILKPLVDKRGWDEVRDVLKCFCELAPYDDYLQRVEANTLRPGEEKVKKFGYHTTLSAFVERYTHWLGYLQVTP